MTEARICAKLRQSHRQKSRYPPHLGRQSSEPGLRLKLYIANFHSRIFNGGSDSDPPFLVYQSLSGAGADAVFTRAAAPASERTTGMSMQGRRPGMRIPGSVAEASKKRRDAETDTRQAGRSSGMKSNAQKTGMRIPGSVAEASEEAKRRWDGYTACQPGFRGRQCEKVRYQGRQRRGSFGRSEETLGRIHGMPTGVPG